MDSKISKALQLELTVNNRSQLFQIQIVLEQGCSAQQLPSLPDSIYVFGQSGNVVRASTTRQNIAELAKLDMVISIDQAPRGV
jgi:hypothetical protein